MRYMSKQDACLVTIQIRTFQNGLVVSSVSRFAVGHAKDLETIQTYLFVVQDVNAGVLQCLEILARVRKFLVISSNEVGTKPRGKAL